MFIYGVALLSICTLAGLFVGIFASYVAGAGVALAFGYTDAVSLTTNGTGAVTYIVGPVTGAAIGASSEVMALSIAAGLIKAIVVMVATPFVAPYIGLNNPRAAVIFGGLMGTSSGVAGGLAATDPKLVPYGCLTAARPARIATGPLDSAPSTFCWAAMATTMGM